MAAHLDAIADERRLKAERIAREAAEAEPEALAAD